MSDSDGKLIRDRSTKAKSEWWDRVAEAADPYFARRALAEAVRERCAKAADGNEDCPCPYVIRDLDLTDLIEGHE